MNKILNTFDRKRKLAIKIIAEDISSKEEDAKQRYNTLIKLSDDQIDRVLENLNNPKKVSATLNILKKLNGHKQSSEIMEYVLCFEGKLLSALNCLFYNKLFLSCNQCCSIISNLCFVKATDEELLDIIIQLNNLFIILEENKDNKAIDAKGYANIVEDIINKDALSNLYDVQSRIYEDLENITITKVLGISKGR